MIAVYAEGNDFRTLLFIAPNTFNPTKWFESRKEASKILNLTYSPC